MKSQGYAFRGLEQESLQQFVVHLMKKKIKRRTYVH